MEGTNRIPKLESTLLSSIMDSNHIFQQIRVKCILRELENNNKNNNR